MPKLAVPLSREFRLVPKGISEDDPIIVVFRQATQGDFDKRQELLSVPVTRAWDQQNNFSVQSSLVTFSQRMAVDMWLTMESCNITDRNDRPIFHGDISKMPLNKFKEKLAPFPPEWTQAMYESCLKVNPDWGYGTEDEIEDEEFLTEGEGGAGLPATE